MVLKTVKQRQVWEIIKENPNYKAEELLERVNEPHSQKKIAEVSTYSRIIPMIFSFSRKLTDGQIAENTNCSESLVKQIVKHFNLMWRFRDKREKKIITRKFALSPRDPSIVNAIREQLIKFRNLENKYVNFLVNEIRNDPALIHNKAFEYPNFRLTISKAEREELKKRDPEETIPTSAKMRIRKYIYDYYTEKNFKNDPPHNLSTFTTDSYKRLEFIERVNQNALQYPYYAVRNWIIRNERLRNYISVINSLLASTKTRRVYDYSEKRNIQVNEGQYVIKAFLTGEKLYREFLGDFKKGNKQNVLGDYENISYEEIAQCIGQLRNIFLSKTSLDPLLRTEISNLISLLNNHEQNPNQDVSAFFTSLFSSFSLKNNSTLQEFFLKRFIQHIRRRTSELAKLKLKGKKLYGKGWVISFVEHLFQVNSISTLSEFKKIRDPLVNTFTITDLQNYSHISEKALRIEVIKKLCTYLNDLLHNAPSNIVKGIFKPHFSRVSIKSLDFEGFQEYFFTRLFYQAKELLKTLFLNKNSFLVMKQKIAEELNAISSDMYTITSIPKIKELTIPLIVSEHICEFDEENLCIQFGLLKRKGKEYQLEIKSKKQRSKFQELLETYKRSNSPIIKLEGRKIVLCQPFEQKTGTSSKEVSQPDISQLNVNIEIGGDLGLIHFGVLSVRDKSKPSNCDEVKRYFLDQRTLFDMTFNVETGKFEYIKYINVFVNEKGEKIKNIVDKQKNPTNMKLSLRNLRKELKIIQRLKAEYENRHPNDYWKKIKWYHRARAERCIWNKIQKINKEIVNRISALIVQIVRFHGASRVKFEDLSWSRHEKKRKKGKFLAFWQTHWFYSQIQTKTAQGVNRLGCECVTVDARNTSRNCAVCGHKGIRNGKIFTCKECNTEVDSDLNASRAVGKRNILRNVSI